MIAGFLFFFIKKNNIYVSVQRVVCCSHQSDSLAYVFRTNQIAALGYLFRTKQRRFCCALWYALACIACLYMFI